MERKTPFEYNNFLTSLEKLDRDRKHGSEKITEKLKENESGLASLKYHQIEDLLDRAFITREQRGLILNAARQTLLNPESRRNDTSGRIDGLLKEADEYAGATSRPSATRR